MYYHVLSCIMVKSPLSVYYQQGFLSSAVLEVGKRVRHGFRNSRDSMLEERPNTVVPEEEEEIETITCHDIKKGGGGSGS